MTTCCTLCYKSPMLYDLLTFGEVMVRFTPPSGQRLEQARTLDVAFGGTEANVAVVLARLGLRTAWVSRLPENSWGRRITRELMAHGVETSHVVWDAEARVGTFFLEFGSPPRPSSIIYDRKHSAASQMSPGDISTDLISQSRWLHLTGITPALSDTCEGLVREVMQEARSLGIPTSFDLNYRSRLWRPEQAADTVKPLCQMATILFGAERDARLLFRHEAEGAALAEAVQAQLGCPIVVLTQSENGALAMADGKAVHAPAFPVQMVDRIGAGDAFVGGFLFAHLQGWPLADALRWGNAVAALKLTIPGDFALVSRQEVESVLGGQAASLQR